MRSFDCTPQCSPNLPDCSTHPLWQAWDATVEQCLLQVHSMQSGSGPLPMEISSSAGAAVYSQRAVQGGTGQSSAMTFHSPFFNEQLLAFEVWLDFGGPGGSYKDNKEPPVCLPILFQVRLTILQQCNIPTNNQESNGIDEFNICVALVGIVIARPSLESPSPSKEIRRTGSGGGSLDLGCGGIPLHPEAAT
jgi:hypothetical protein